MLNVTQYEITWILVGIPSVIFLNIVVSKEKEECLGPHPDVYSILLGNMKEHGY
jgi:hypothetical protein